VIAWAPAATRSTALAAALDALNPDLHTVFGVGNGSGVLDLLRGGATHPETACLQLSPVPGLRIVTVGNLNGDTPALIASPRMGQLLAYLRQQADVVVIDSPALGAASDAALIAAHADAVFMVVDSMRTTARALRSAQAVLARVSAPPCEILLNKVAARDEG
jgi:Mrp family chromosome partitioning ATPase